MKYHCRRVDTPFAGAQENAFARKEPMRNGNSLVQKFMEATLSLYESEKAAGTRGAAHDKNHAMRVAMNCMEYVRANFNGPQTERAMKLAATLGVLHDFVRAPKEAERSEGHITADLIEHIGSNFILNSKKDDVISALKRMDAANPKGMGDIFGYLQNGILQTDEWILGEAIRIHEMDVGKIAETANGMRAAGQDMRACLQEALLFADKGLEGVGQIVVVRRAQFVAGERFEKGDLKEFGKKIVEDGFSADTARALCFVLESMIRIYSQKPLGEFPENMRAELVEKRKFEYEFYDGILQDTMFALGAKSEMTVLGYGMSPNHRYPKLRESLGKITEAISSKKPGENGVVGSGAKETVLALAYSESHEPQKREYAKAYGAIARNGAFEGLLEQSGEGLKGRLLSSLD